MRIPETVIYDDVLPESGCLLLLPGAVIGEAEDAAERLLQAENVTPAPEEPVREIFLRSVPAEHVLCGRAERLGTGETAPAELLKRRLREAIALADALGVEEMSFLSLPAAPIDSRLFGVMTVFFRELMAERERHPSLTGIRFLCPDKNSAAMIARVYNFYYPEDKSERMEVPEQA